MPDNEALYAKLMVDVEATIPCGICQEPTTFLGTKRCNNCWEVEKRLGTLLHSESGRAWLRDRLAEHVAEGERTEACDVDGCQEPAIDCIGGEVYFCADHGDQAVTIYEEYQ